MSAPGDTLQIRMLGELRMLRNGVPQSLPPSKKTRALLGYLLLSGREQRRERLCSMFWDVADDPRGALRWSLSRLRSLLDDPQAARLKPGRETVGVELLGAEVDALALRRAVFAAGGVERMETAALEHWAESFSGELLEGLDLPDFEEYQAFLVGQREELRGLRIGVLRSLSSRLAASPERALSYGRCLAKLDPGSLSARVELLRLAHLTGRVDEATQHYTAARRHFQEIGSRDLAALERAWHQLRQSPASSTASSQPAAPVLDESAPRVSRLSWSLGANDSEVIGRGEELAFLRTCLKGVVSEQRPKVVLLSGEPGIGKSHVLRFFSDWARARNLQVVAGTAYEGERSRPYGPLLDCVRATGELAPIARMDSSHAMPVLEDERARQRSREELFAGTAQFIERCAGKAAALCLILEDAQWLDRASAELLHYAARSMKAPALILLSVRSEEAADNPALVQLLRGLRRDRLLEERSLAPLDAAAMEALLGAHGCALDPERVAEQSGGNPLFALEIARLGEIPGERLPESISEAVRERLARLSAECAEVLRWGAVLGGAFHVRELSDLSRLSQETLVEALESLERAALLRCEPSPGSPDNICYRFAHELVRRVVYADLSGARRQLLHGRVARTLYARDVHDEERLSRLVRHAALAQEHALAAEACVAAGTRCLRLYAYSQANALACQGVRHAEQLSGLESMRLLIELLEIQLRCAPRRQAAALAERIRALGEWAHSTGAFSHARRAHKVLSYWHFDEDGPLGLTQHHITMAELISRHAAPDEQLGSLSEAARCMLLLGREHERARGLLHDAEQQAQRLHLEPAVLRDAQGLAHLFRGEYERAAPCFEQAAALASAERNPVLEFHALDHRATLEFERHDHHAAARFCRTLVDVARSVRAGAELPYAQGLEAMARYALDPTCHQEVEIHMDRLRVLEAQRRLMHALAVFTQLDALHGCAARALVHAHETLALARALQRPNELYLALGVMCWAETELGHPERAAQARAELSLLDEREVAEGSRKNVPRLWAARTEARQSAEVG
ncbi:MAG: AAA family ATPase [Myxococcales bacterium]